jgi:hypothetical protein
VFTVQLRLNRHSSRRIGPNRRTTGYGPCKTCKIWAVYHVFFYKFERRQNLYENVALSRCTTFQFKGFSFGVLSEPVRVRQARFRSEQNWHGEYF